MAASSSSEAVVGNSKRTPILQAASVRQRIDLNQAMRWVRQTYRKGLLRQVAEMLPLILGKSKLSAEEYYLNGLYRPDLAAADRRAFVSLVAGERLNKRLSPPSALNAAGLLNDKLLTGITLQGAGFPVMPTLAACGAGIQVPSVRCLPDARALAEWLRTEAPLPVFGKPVRASLGVGAVSILKIERDGETATLGDGRMVPLTELVAEVAVLAPQGYMIQPLIRLHPDVARIAGTAAAMLRICTLRDEKGIAPLYAVLRLPSKDAMIDTNTPRSANGLALIDTETGRIVRAQSNWKLATTPLAMAPATGAPLDLVVLPFMAEAVALCVNVHGLFPAHGVLGFDIALTSDGPIVNEVNTNPHHTGYQRASAKGLLGAEFRPGIVAAETASRKFVAALEAENARRAGAT